MTASGWILVPEHHILKTWPESFAAVLSGAKRFEYRVDDRGYRVGDILHLREYVPSDDGWRQWMS